MLDSSELKDKVIELQRRFDGKKLLLGYDRMDYVKGITLTLALALALPLTLTRRAAWRRCCCATSAARTLSP